MDAISFQSNKAIDVDQLRDKFFKDFTDERGKHVHKTLSGYWQWIKDNCLIKGSNNVAVVTEEEEAFRNFIRAHHLTAKWEEYINWLK